MSPECVAHLAHSFHVCLDLAPQSNGQCHSNPALHSSLKSLLSVPPCGNRIYHPVTDIVDGQRRDFLYCVE